MERVIPRSLRKRFRLFKRRLVRRRVILIMLGMVLPASVSYAYLMDTQRSSVDPRTCVSLLSLIAAAESNGNYNAYFGNSGNTSIDFTNMTIAEVMRWQHRHVVGGSPSSAVGRYQFINTTLSGLVAQLGIDTERKFDEHTQDMLAIALIERRGAVAYINQELSREEFAANLAKEWAGLPKVIGDDPAASYYAGDGLNASRVKPEAVLEAIEPIAAK